MSHSVQSAPQRVTWYLIPLLVSLWFLDGGASGDGRGGWERHSVYNSQRRWANRPHAKVAIMGSSTSKDWLPERELARLVGVRAGQVLDAHINGCHQGCTWAQVRALRAQGRRFKYIFFGTNLFQLCEDIHSKRVLQQQMMLPRADIPELFGLYARAEQPLQYMSRFIGMQASDAYGDTRVIQSSLARSLFGRGRRGHEWRWVSARRPARARKVNVCTYEPERVAYKRAVSQALYRDLSAMAEHVFIMLLPDPSVGQAEHRAKWDDHYELQRSLIKAHSNVHLVDLVDEGARSWSSFRDSIHLHRRAMPAQLKLFKRRVRELGVLKPIDEAQGASKR